MKTNGDRQAFFRQAVLIVLPVVVLAVLAFLALRQDRLLVEHDAAERAQGIAEDLAPRLWTELTASNESALELVVDASGRLHSPPAWEILPTPTPLDLEDLTAGQREMWTALRTGLERDEALAAYAQFLDSKPPARFAAVALYEMGCRLCQANENSAALKAFQEVCLRYPTAQGETGLPLLPLAQFQILEIKRLTQDAGEPAVTEAEATPQIISKLERTPEGGWRWRFRMGTNAPTPNGDQTARENIPTSVDSLCSNLVYRPTAMTGFILERLAQANPTGQDSASIQHWQQVWTHHEDLRRLHQSLKHFVIATNQETPLRRALWLSSLPVRTACTQTTVGSGITPSAALTASTNSPATNTTRPWLVLMMEAPGGARFVCHPEGNVISLLDSFVAGPGARPLARQIPDYMGLSVEIASRKLVPSQFGLRMWTEGLRASRSGGQPEKQYSETVATRLLGSAVSPGALLTARLYLTSPSGLMKHTRARTFWMACVILASAVAAFAGVISAYRNFQRQLRLSELKSNFVSSVSHELRAPTASILLMAENLDRGKVTEIPRQKEYFSLILQECRRLSSLIEHVLDFSRIESGRKQYEFGDTNLTALVAETLETMRLRAASQGVTLVPAEHALDRELQATVDGKAIQQALINLVDNAVKHSPKGETVTVGLEQAEDAIEMWVEDHGPGIPESEHEKIFERFYRCGSELRRQTQGVGIGLSIVKHVVEAHGGQVRVRSAEGQGSRFTIRLPLAPAQ